MKGVTKEKIRMNIEVSSFNYLGICKWECHYPMQMLVNRCESPDKGAPPHRMNCIRTPSIACICLKAMTSHSILSSAEVPNQLPSMAAIRRLHPMLKSFFANPPFSSTWCESKRH
jgi:hypothetical protein